MKKTSRKSGKTLKAVGLIIGIGVLLLLVGLTGCNSHHTRQSRGEQIDDQGLSSQVRNALQSDTQYKFGDVNVVTYNDVVQLSGFVNSADQKNRAGDLAGKVKGVKEVKNNISIKE